MLAGVMAAAMTETLVTFSSGATDGRGVVLRSAIAADASPLVVVDRTPFHPVDHTWPDQPGDQGSCGGRVVVDTLMAAIDRDGELVVGAAIPVKRGEPGWTWVVAHQLADPADLPAVNSEVSLVVDGDRRLALSAAHTACHLAALAMNRAAATFWRKDVRTDSLGSPDLDQLAMVTSAMDVSGSTDVYRFGKSLRKRGFDPQAFAQDIDDVVATARGLLRGWLASGAAVEVKDDGDLRITARRRWTCALGEGLAEIPCGGTHVPSLGTLSAISIDYQLSSDGSGLTVRTTPTLAA